MTSVKLDLNSGKLTPHGERKVAQSMYDMGKSFLNAAARLRLDGGYEYVVLHLICQGMEIVLKAFLLYKNYDKYISQLRKPIGHDLLNLAKTASEEFGVKLGSKSVILELERLNPLYMDHMLRYGSFYDLLVDPQNNIKRQFNVQADCCCSVS